MRGTIVKGIGGFYYVFPETGGALLECRARGLFRKERITPCVGDRVICSVVSSGDGQDQGVIEEILERKNVFIRPPVSNVDCFVIVMAAAEPSPNFLILDQFLVMAEQEQTDAVICINKVDLAEEKTLSELCDIYEGLYPLHFVCGRSGQGTEKLAQTAAGRNVALAGPSGVGKSTILNQLLGKKRMQTGEISQKTRRGRHTTRHVELFPMEEGGMLFDTPGFTSFDILNADESELFYFFPEMEACAGKCRYDNCRHVSEPDCAVREALAAGKIHPSRYRSYIEMLQILQKKKPW